MTAPLQDITGDEHAVNQQIPRNDQQQRQRQQVDPMRVGNAVRGCAKNHRRQECDQGEPVRPGAVLLQRGQRRVAVFNHAQDLLRPFAQERLDMGRHTGRAFGGGLQGQAINFIALYRAEQLALGVTCWCFQECQSTKLS